MDIEHALDRFVEQLEADGRSGHTVRQYKRHVHALARWATTAGLPGEVEDLRAEDVARFLVSPSARTRPDGGPKKATSANTLRTSLRCFFAFLHDAGHVPTNPARLVRRARCAPPPPRPIPETDLRMLLSTIEKADGPEAKRDHMLFHLLSASGLRLGSAMGLEVEDVDLERGELWIKTAKGDRPDTVLLGAGIRQHLARFLAGRTSGPLFADRRGRRLGHRHVQRRFREWLAKAGIKRPATIHGLRHGFATRLYAKTGDVLLVKEALRHRSIMSTMRYLAANRQRVIAAMMA